MNATIHAQLQADTQLKDGLARLNSIDPSKSCIVQAPAGSGKTALLTLRYLALLTLVDAPEKIVAITFTKKAAAEMRERIIEALSFDDAKPSNTYEANLQILSQAAAQADKQHNWNLLENPNRLRIKTIDSLNAHLVQQMPYLSRLGIQPKIDDNPEELYLQAARDALKDIEVETHSLKLLELLNGSYSQAENLIAEMLQKRDQWMPHLAKADNFAQLEKALETLVEGKLKSCLADLKHYLVNLSILPEHAVFALKNKPELQLKNLVQANSLGTNLEQLAAWREAAGMLLTGSDTLRKTIDARSGYPAGKGEAKEFKDAFLELLENLRNDEEKVTPALVALKNIPDPAYSDEQLENLEHLLFLIQRAAGHLKLNFKEAQTSDFTEIAQAAEIALGTEEEPTDLALQMDYQIQHLLIDEFQDTSLAQYKTIKKLLNGWQKGDGRTLFIVGDPMQSIYRFRKAEVSNFLQAWNSHDLPLELEQQTLEVNFRSNASLVNWFNQTFKQAFPIEEDLTLGAVNYTQASPKDANDQHKTAINYHFATNADSNPQTQEIVELIKTHLASTQAEQTLAILGRTRTQLALIAHKLKEENIPFSAVELERLDERQEIQDALALVRALNHPEDRDAWLALLRTPFIGLNLKDLYYFTSTEDRIYTPLPLLLKQGIPSEISSIGQENLARAIPLLNQALEKIDRSKNSQTYYQTWLALGGATSLATEQERNNIQEFFQGLTNFDDQILNLTDLENWLRKLYAQPDPNPEAQRIQLMTMHKSKGLQFDTVILPQLQHTGRGDTQGLISWLEFVDSTTQKEQLLLSPLDPKTDGKSPLNQLIHTIEKDKQLLENARLLYVATTRAERELHLFAHIKQNKEDAENAELTSPRDASLLHPIWDQVKDQVTLLETPETEDIIPAPAKVKRLKNLANFDLHSYAGKQELTIKTLEKQEDADIKQQISTDDSPRVIGNLVHAILEQMANQGIENWETTPLENRKANYIYWLEKEGLTPEQVSQALEKALDNINKVLAHPQGRWSLEKHQDATSELALSSRFNTHENHIIDRTFISENQRWIIDFKTAVKPTNISQEDFIQQQIELYKPQLERYGELFKHLESLEQRKIIYLTAEDLWIEI